MKSQDYDPTLDQRMLAAIAAEDEIEKKEREAKRSANPDRHRLTRHLANNVLKRMKGPVGLAATAAIVMGGVVYAADRNTGLQDHQAQNTIHHIQKVKDKNISPELEAAGY